MTYEEMGNMDGKTLMILPGTCCDWQTNFGSPDLDQSGRLAAWLQSKLVVPLLTSFTKNEKKRNKTRDLLKNTF